MRVRLHLARLQQLLAQGTFSQNHWAIRLRLSKGHLSNLLSGKHLYPSARTRERMLEVLEVPFEDLFEIESGHELPDFEIQGALRDRYIIDKQIGQGGMGTVYLARDIRLGRAVAIKIVSAEVVSGVGGNALLKEIINTNRLQHPNVLLILDAGEANGSPFYVMPFVRGGSLRDLLQRDGRVPVGRALQILAGMTAALDHAHTLGILHCDVKPANVLLADDHAWLIDFGIARVLQQEVLSPDHRPDFDSGAGTPAYVSPEQAEGRVDLDRRSDVYSLACTMFEMLAGEPPFVGSTTLAIVAKRFAGPPPALADLAPHLPRELSDALIRAMAVDRAARTPTAAAFLRDCRRAVAAAGSVVGLIPASPSPDVASAFETAIANSWQDLRFAFRSLRKQATFTLIAVLTLALGIGATTATFTVLRTVLLRPLPYRDADRLVLMRERSRSGDLGSPSFPNFADWRAQTHSFDGVASEMYPWAQTVTAGTEPLRAIVMGVSQGFFAVLGVRPLRGREFTSEENQPGGPPAVMVSYDFWKNQMHGRNDLGTILYGDRATPVVGVLPQGFRFIDDADLYLPHERFAGTCRSCHNYRVVARLAPGISVSTAQAEMTTLSHTLLATYGTETGAADANVTSLREYVVANFRVMLLVIFGAAGMVLLIACSNLVSAQLARGLMRGRELAIRAALGASRGRIIRQLLLESSLLALVGSAAGAGVAALCIWTVRHVGAGSLPRVDELRLDGQMLLAAMGIGAISAVLVGVYPALRLTGGQPGKLLHGARGSGVTIRRGIWRALVGFEIATAIVLLIGSLLLIRTLHNILSADTGFEAHGIVTAALAAPDTIDLVQLERIRAALSALPGVEGVAFTNHVPLEWGSASGPVRRPSDPLDRDWPAMAGFRLLTADYFGVLHQRMVRGRAFTAADIAGSTPVAIITPGIAQRLWPGEDPLGKTIATNYLMRPGPDHKPVDDWLTVVGVVAEASSWTMGRGEQNEIYVPIAQHPTRAEGQLVAMIRTGGNPSTLIPFVRSRLRELVPTLPPRLGTLDDRIAKTAASRTFAMVALTIFGVIAMVLAGVGIYGTLAYIAATRTHEIGVRMALGATSGRVRRVVLLDAGTMALGGIVVGAIAAVFSTRFLAATLYGVSHIDPLAYIGGAAALLLTALLGAYVPARRSSRVDPLQAMRSE